MTEAQYNTLIFGFAVTIGSTIAAAMIALLINNARLGDVKDALRSEIDSKTSVTRESILAQTATTSWTSFPRSPSSTIGLPV